MAAAAKKKKVPLNQRLDIGDYPYTECREQHVWKPYDGTIDNRAKLAYRVQKCANCPTKRHSVLSLRAEDYGQLVKPSRYNWPSDYRVEGGLDRADLGHIRMANFLREVSE